MSYSVKVYNLAKFIHEKYEALSIEEGWETQAPCKVEFDDLPEANLKVMIGVAGSIIEYIRDDLQNASRIIT